MIKGKIDDTIAKKRLISIKAKGNNLATPMRAIANMLENSVKKNFDVGGRFSKAGSPIGGSNKWEPVDNPLLKGTTLKRSGMLQRSITNTSDNKSATVSSGLIYARFQNDGGKTKPHVIKAKLKQALAFLKGGTNLIRTQVNHPGSNIPARPFMVAQPEDIEYAKEVIADHLSKKN